MSKAKSRLPDRAAPPAPTPPTHAVELPTSSLPSNSSVSFFSKLKLRYIRHWPLLLLAILSWLVVAYIIITMSPIQAADMGLKQFFLPLIVPFWLATFFSCALLFLNSRRGAILASWLTLLLLLRLQKIIITNELILSTAAIFFVLAIVMEIWLAWRNR